MKACTLRALVRKHFDGTISPDAEHVMREHLSDCSECQRLYRRRLMVSRLDPEALSSEIRIARGLGFGPNRRMRPEAVSLGLAGVAAAALLLLAVKIELPMTGFSSRGHVRESGTRSSRVIVYDIPEHRKPTIATGTLSRGDELAFTYENGNAKRRLAIFGIDEHGHVFWFYPAWTVEVDEPTAIPVAVDDDVHELPEAIRHHFDGKHLEIRSLFLDRPISTQEIEALLRQTPSGPLPIPGALESSVSLELVP